VRELLEQKARELQQPLHMEMQVDSVQLALQLVKRGVGYLVLTERALADATAARLSAVPIRRPTLKRTAQLIGTEASLRRPVVRALFEAILESGAALSGGNGPSRRVGSSGAGGAAKR
jgi:DNA-binding transcriptional LysR family regulator